MPEGIEELIGAAEAARGRFIHTVEGLGPAAATQTLGEDRWTAGQYTEHLVRAEEATLWRLWGVMEEARSGGEVVVSSTPELPIEAIVERTWRPREQAPPLAVPRWGGAVAFWLARLRGHHQLLAAFGEAVEPTELDRLAYEHPISGPFTFRQGLQFIRFHLDRHRGHVEEIAARSREGR